MQWLLDIAKELFGTPRGFVDRGDPANTDWSPGNLIGDDAWHDLDLSSIVPADTVAVVLRISMVQLLLNNQIDFRKKGHVNFPNVAESRPQAVNRGIQYDKTVACDSNRFIQYRLTTPTWAFLGITLIGWFGPES